MHWDWCKNEDINWGDTTGQNDYGGYSPKELYVYPKYQHYKQEVLQHIDIIQYNDIIIPKINEYMRSSKVKKRCQDKS